MLASTQITTKANRFWPKLLNAAANKTSILPIVIPLSPPNSQQLMSDFSGTDQWARKIKAYAAKHQLPIQYKTLNHRQLGRQNIPARLIIESTECFTRLIDKRSDWSLFQQNLTLTSHELPELQPWLQQKARHLDHYQHQWSRLVKVVQYFKANPRPDCYLRELDISGVDSKFIESHINILAELLAHCLVNPDDRPNDQSQGSTGQARGPKPGSNRISRFCQRYHLKYDQPLIRFRWLDESLSATTGGLDDLSIPLTSLANMAVPAQHVFITENKINGLSFPACNNSLVIFGLGYGVEALAEITWLKDKDIHYWGDIDTHGISILAHLRDIYPQLRSFLMDEKTLLQCRSLWGSEPEDGRYTGELAGLTPAEQQLYQDLLDNKFGKNLRLEQERIPFALVAKDIGDSYLLQRISG